MSASTIETYLEHAESIWTNSIYAYLRFRELVQLRNCSQATVKTMRRIIKREPVVFYNSCTGKPESPDEFQDAQSISCKQYTSTLLHRVLTKTIPVHYVGLILSSPVELEQLERLIQSLGSSNRLHVLVFQGKHPFNWSPQLFRAMKSVKTSCSFSQVKKLPPVDQLRAFNQLQITGSTQEEIDIICSLYQLPQYASIVKEIGITSIRDSDGQIKIQQLYLKGPEGTVHLDDFLHLRQATIIAQSVVFPVRETLLQLETIRIQARCENTLQSLRHASQVDLSHSQVEDLTGLGKISEINLSNTNVSDVTALKSVKSLNIAKTSVRKVGTLKSVEHLHLSSTVAIVDVATQLKSLEIPATSTFVAFDAHKFQNLVTLNAAGVERLDLRAIGQCQRLKYLDLSWCAMSNEDFQQLRTDYDTLKLRRTFLTDAGRFRHVRDLDLSGSAITSVRTLENGTIRCIDISNTYVSDVDALRSVETLIAANTKISDVSMLGNLIELDASNTFVTTVETHGRLKKLNLSETLVRDVSALRNVQILTLRNCSLLENVSPALENVQQLDLSGCSKVRCVSGLGNIHTLNVARTMVDDVSQLKNVHEINLAQTRVMDVSGLESVHLIHLDRTKYQFLQATFGSNHLLAIIN